MTGRWYITKHAVDQYIKRFNGVSRRHAIDQLVGITRTAEHYDTKPTGIEVYKSGDMTLLVDADQRVLTVY